MACKASGQVGIGDEELAKAHGICLSSGNDPICLLLLILLIGNEDTAELLLELRSETISPVVLSCEEEGKPATAQLARSDYFFRDEI